MVGPLYAAPRAIGSRTRPCGRASAPAPRTLAGMRRLLGAAALLLAASVAHASPPPASLVGAALPPFEGVEWVANAPARGLQPGDFRGRVLVLAFFEVSATAGDDGGL